MRKSERAVFGREKQLQRDVSIEDYVDWLQTGRESTFTLKSLSLNIHVFG